MSLRRRVADAVAASGSRLCLGLDPDLASAPTAAAAEDLCQRLLDAALPYACAVKPNLAFFEQHGAAGYAVLERLRSRVPADRLLILDAKRGDIGSTADAYARALFDVLGADAVTVNPLMGEDAVRPFLRPEGGCFVLTRTSNPGAADLLTRRLDDGTTVYERIVDLALRWDGGAGTVGLVVGATDVDAVAAVRRRAPSLPLLLPGVGAQGGSLEAATAAGRDAKGGGLLVTVSRGIAGAPEGPAAAARGWAQRLQLAVAQR